MCYQAVNSQVTPSGMSVSSPLMKFRLEFDPPVFLLSTTDDTLRARAELVEDQDYVGQEQYQVYETLKYIGALSVEIHYGHQQRDQ